MRASDLRPDTIVRATTASAGAFGRGVRRVLGGDLDSRGDAQVSLLVDAGPAAVWAVLADGAGYGDWVVGAKPVREVDAGWPAVGTSLHYSFGLGPIEIRDLTTVRRSEPERALDLDIVIWPVGSVRAWIRLEPRGGRTLVRLDEHPAAGVARLLATPLGSAGFAARGALMLSRLRALVESTR